MILEKTVSKNIQLSVIGCDAETDLDRPIYLIAHLRFSGPMLFKTFSFFLRRKAASYHTFTNVEFSQEQLLLIHFDNSKHVLETLAHKRWIKMCWNFPLLYIHSLGLSRSSFETSYASPQKGMIVKMWSFHDEEGGLEPLTDVAAKDEVFVSYMGRKVALMGYRLFSDKWKSAFFPHDQLVLLSAFDEEAFDQLYRSPEFKELISVTHGREIGVFIS